MITRNYNTPFVAYDLLCGYITLIFNVDDWLVSFWVGGIIRGGIRKPSNYFGLFNLWFKS